MNNNPKISLTIYIEGSARHIIGRKKVPYILKQVDVMPKLYPTKKDKASKAAQRVVKKGYYKTVIDEYVDAQQHITLTQEAYEYMTSGEMPYWLPFNPMVDKLANELKVSGKFKPKVGDKVWKKLTPEKRLEAHMQYICESLNGKGFSYTVLED